MTPAQTALAWFDSTYAKPDLAAIKAMSGDEQKFAEREAREYYRTLHVTLVVIVTTAGLMGSKKANEHSSVYLRELILSE